MGVYSLLAFPLGDQKQQNHRIDDLLFSGKRVRLEKGNLVSAKVP